MKPNFLSIKSISNCSRTTIKFSHRRKLPKILYTIPQRIRKTSLSPLHKSVDLLCVMAVIKSLYGLSSIKALKGVLVDVCECLVPLTCVVLGPLQHTARSYKDAFHLSFSCAVVRFICLEYWGSMPSEKTYIHT